MYIQWIYMYYYNYVAGHQELTVEESAGTWCAPAGAGRHGSLESAAQCHWSCLHSPSQRWCPRRNSWSPPVSSCDCPSLLSGGSSVETPAVRGRVYTCVCTCTYSHLVECQWLAWWVLEPTAVSNTFPSEHIRVHSQTTTQDWGLKSGSQRQGSTSWGRGSVSLHLKAGGSVSLHLEAKGLWAYTMYNIMNYQNVQV